MIKTIFDEGFKLLDIDFEFDYQKELTKKLDSEKSAFDQNILNEIVLWKVNRYAQFSPELISELNSIKSDDISLDFVKTKSVLEKLLRTNGVKLAMASTILRFRNPNIYQIIDQRVFRLIYPGQELKLSSYMSDSNIEHQINLYFDYLADLRQICSEFNIEFHRADRILFMADRRINKGHKLKK
jgi:hypothetical protein